MSTRWRRRPPFDFSTSPAYLGRRFAWGRQANPGCSAVGGQWLDPLDCRGRHPLGSVEWMALLPGHPHLARRGYATVWPCRRESSQSGLSAPTCPGANATRRMTTRSLSAVLQHESSQVRADSGREQIVQQLPNLLVQGHSTHRPVVAGTDDHRHAVVLAEVASRQVRPDVQGADDAGLLSAQRVAPVVVGRVARRPGRTPRPARRPRGDRSGRAGLPRSP